MLAKYELSDHAKKKNHKPYPIRNLILMILLTMIDSLFLMVSEVYGSKVLAFAVHREAIGKIANLAHPNH